MRLIGQAVIIFETSNPYDVDWLVGEHITYSLRIKIKDMLASLRDLDQREGRTDPVRDAAKLKLGHFLRQCSSCLDLGVMF